MSPNHPENGPECKTTVLAVLSIMILPNLNKLYIILLRTSPDLKRYVYSKINQIDRSNLKESACEK